VSTGAASLEIFESILPSVRSHIRQHVPADWPEFAALLRSLTEEPLGPLATLPLASCAAAGGDPEAAVPVAATWEVLSVAVRILDDAEDQDRPDALWNDIGVARAVNYGTALYAFSHHLLAQASWPASLHLAIQQDFGTAALIMACGQDRDLRGEVMSLEAYWRLIEEKNAAAFAAACAAGARCGTDDRVPIDACREYGHHLGLALQLFDDFEGLWEPNGEGDLALGKITLPLLYGLETDHPRRDELRDIVRTGDLARERNGILAILDAIDTREFMVWSALQERQLALDALSVCPGEAGVAALDAYVTSLFAHIEDAL
jgi:geranylgeranyl diphosphate synthase type I